MKNGKNVDPAEVAEAAQASVPLPAQTVQDQLNTMIEMSNHYRVKCDELEQQWLIATSEAKRHARGRVVAETELGQLRSRVEELEAQVAARKSIQRKDAPTIDGEVSKGEN